MGQLKCILNSQEGHSKESEQLEKLTLAVPFLLLTCLDLIVLVISLNLHLVIKYIPLYTLNFLTPFNKVL